MAIALEGTPVANNADAATLAATVGAATNNLLAVFSQLYHGSASRSVSGVTFNGDALAPGPTLETNSGGERDRASLHYLANPDVTTANIVLTPSGTGTTVRLGYAQFSGVDQVAPDGNTATQADSSSPIQISVTAAAAGSLLLMATSIVGSGSATPDANTSELAEANSGSGLVHGLYSRSATGASAFTLGATLSGLDHSTLVGLELLAASAAPAPSIDRASFRGMFRGMGRGM